MLASLSSVILSASEDSEKFYLEADNQSVPSICADIGLFFKRRVICSNAFQDKKVSLTVESDNIKEILDALAFAMNTSFVEKDGAIFFGGLAKSTVVTDIPVNDDMQKAFEGVKMTVVNSKMIINGEQQQIESIQDKLKQVYDLDFAECWLFACQVTYDEDMQLGIDWQRVLTYTASWENMLKGQFNPAQMLALSVVANAKAQLDFKNQKVLLNTCVTFQSGREAQFQDGQQVQLLQYTTSDQGTRVTSGYVQQNAGTILKITGFKYLDHWVFDCNIEKSVLLTATDKTITTLKNRVKLRRGESVLLGSLDENGVTETVVNGVPFLSSIPIIKYLFCISEDKRVNRKIFFILTMKGENEQKDKLQDLIHDSAE